MANLQIKNKTQFYEEPSYQTDKIFANSQEIVVEYYSIKKTSFEEALENKLLHYIEGPAAIYTDLQGSLLVEQFYREGLLHRIDGPAVIDYVMEIKEWRLYDELHRTDGPAYQEADIYQEWWQDGRLSRDPNQGPAIIHQEAGLYQYWLDGLPLDNFDQ